MGIAKKETAKQKYNRKMAALVKAAKKKQKQFDKLNKLGTKHPLSKTALSKAINKINNDAAKLKKQNATKKKNNAFKTKSKANVKKSKFFGIRSYIMPNNPKTDNSFVYIWVSDEQPSHGNSVASQAVEHGVTIATTTQMNIPTIAVTGTIGGDPDITMKQVKADVKRMQNWSDNGSDLQWHGQDVISSVIMSDFAADYQLQAPGTGINSVSVSFTLTVATYFDSNVKKKKKSTKTSGNKSTKKGSGKSKKDTKNYGPNGDINDYYNTKAKAHKYVVAKRGYTYSYVSQKTGVKLSVIEKLNKYPARQIPIGAKIYYS